MIVVDASILVTALADDGPDGDRHRGRLAGERLAAPHLIDVEVVSAWRRLAATGRLDARRAAFARADLRSLPIDRVPHAALLERCWELRSNITTYDAAYVALAELLDAPLVTLDARLSGAPGPTCIIEVVQ
ncbi:MAG TPA: type II toxin-antitoxin system VapC family toxin [Acidimicrobiales bacterium]|nr:type II toxin-antitoxin system VapC family toxin [Acidimicrobiales bacterium]